ncbi:unnamed protein product [Gadus morhua 'NCC']
MTLEDCVSLQAQGNESPKDTPQTPKSFLMSTCTPKNEVRVIITLLESRGHDVHNKGLVVHPDHPWLAASPDGILDGTKLLQIKCPFKSLMSLEEFLTQPNGDIKILDDGKYRVLPNGRAGPSDTSGYDVPWSTELHTGYLDTRNI